ncbi:DUF3310 domain-containing protein [Spirillospora sp. CA-294931]|uniref:DUF3310 domain-containing protein n=1 Tax=Spirillospora sp. CA-294931 TaxID=3240042 RepID=UPI003D90BDA4
MRTAIGQIWADDDGDRWIVGRDYKLRLKDGALDVGMDFLKVHDEVGPMVLVQDVEESLADWEKGLLQQGDPVNHPSHYTSHPSGVEAIQITEWMTFCLGNAVKYIWRAGLKSGDPVEDLRKAVFYITREVERLEASGRNL